MFMKKEKKEKEDIRVTLHNFREIVSKISFKPFKSADGQIKYDLSRHGYFTVAFVDSGGISQTDFSPIVVRESIYVGNVFDFEKILLILLTHPHISEIYYEEKENRILAIFQLPSKIERILEGEEDELF